MPKTLFRSSSTFGVGKHYIDATIDGFGGELRDRERLDITSDTTADS